MPLFLPPLAVTSQEILLPLPTPAAPPTTRQAHSSHQPGPGPAPAPDNPPTSPAILPEPTIHRISSFSTHSLTTGQFPTSTSISGSLPFSQSSLQPGSLQLATQEWQPWTFYHPWFGILIIDPGYFLIPPDWATPVTWTLPAVVPVTASEPGYFLSGGITLSGQGLPFYISFITHF